MRLKNTLLTRKLLRSVAGFAAFGLLASTALGQVTLVQLTTNSDFEADTAGPLGAGTSTRPADWVELGVSDDTTTVSTAYANGGTQSLLIDTTSIAGTWSSPGYSQSFAASEGQVYNLSGYIYNPDPGGGVPVANVWGTYKIEFADIGGNNLEPAYIAKGALDGAGQPYVGAVSDPLVGDVFGGGDQTLDTWIFSEVTAVAPAQTVTVRFVLLNVNGGGTPLYYDDVVGGEQVLVGNGTFDADTAGPLGVGTSTRPAGWTELGVADETTTVSTTYARSAPNSLLIDSTFIAGTWSSPGYKVDIAGVTDGDVLNFNGYIYNPDPGGGVPTANTWGTYKIEFYDLGGNNLEPAGVAIGALDGVGQPYVGAVSAPLVGDVFGGGDQTLDTWIFSEVQATAPVGTVSAGLVILNVNGGGTPLYYDDITGRIAAPNPQKLTVNGMSVAGADVTISLDTFVATDYEAETSPDLVTWTPSGVVGAGTGGTIGVTVPGAAPGFVRVSSSASPVTSPVAEVDCILNDTNVSGDNGSGDLGSDEWSAFVVFDSYTGAYDLSDAPFISDGFGTVTFGMNDLDAGTSQTVSVKTEYIAPENTYGGRPLTDLGGKQVLFTGNANVTEAYAGGNNGEVFVLALDNSGGWGLAAQAFVDVSVNDTDPTDGTLMDTSTGAFSVGLNIPEDGLNLVQVGVRNIGVPGTAGEMTLTNLDICVKDPLDFGPFEGELLTNGAFAGVDATEGLTGWEVFGTYRQDSTGSKTFSDGAVFDPITDHVTWAADTPNNTVEIFLPDVVTNKADDNWNGAYAAPAALQQVFWSPDGPAFGTVANLYGQEVTFSGTYTLTEAVGTNLIRQVTSSGAGNGVVAGQESAVYTVPGLSGSIAGTNLGVRITRDGTGAVEWVGITDQGDANFALTETITVPSASVGGGGDIILTVDNIADNQIRLSIEALDGSYSPVPASSQYVDISGASVGVAVPFSFTQAIAGSGLNLVQIQVQIWGVEDTAGMAKVEDLSAVAATP